jgi:hypothetical protein
VKRFSPIQKLVLFYALVGFVSGCGLARFKIPGFGSMGAIAAGLFLSVATFVWFRTDSQQRSFRRSAMFDAAFVGLTLIVVPYYLIKSRGLKAGLKATGVALSIYVLNIFATVIGALFVRVVGA